MELDFAIDRSGLVAPSHAALYAAFGAWRAACYGTPLASAQLPPGGASLTLPLPANGGAGQLMDRMVLQEALAGGQCIANYTLEVLVVAAGGGEAWSPFGRTGAHLIGNKRIELNGDGPGVQGAPLNATAVRFNVTRVFGTGCTPAVRLSVFAPAPCVPVPPPPPPPRARVKFVLAADGRCLTTNASYPCAGRAYGSCPLFLGDCGAPEAVWDDGGGDPGAAMLTNLGVGAQGATVNADCNSCAVGTVFKVINGSPAAIAFSGGKLRYACGSTPGLCLSGGLQGRPNKPCDPTEPVLAQQARVALCASEGTTWVRQAAA